MSFLTRLLQLLLSDDDPNPKRKHDLPSPSEELPWSLPELSGDFSARLEAVRREIEARRLREHPGQGGPAPRETPFEREVSAMGKQEFEYVLQSLERVLDDLGYRDVLAALRDADLTGRYTDGPLVIRQEYVTLPNLDGRPLEPPRVAVVLRRPAYVMDQPPHTYFKTWRCGVWAYEADEGGEIHLVVGRTEEPLDSSGPLRAPIGKSAFGGALVYDPFDLETVREIIENRLLIWARDEALRG